MDSHPKLSFCIATRNRAGLLSETLHSIISQATEEIEIVIVDGASTDNTGQVIQDYQEQFVPLRYIRKDVNGGVDRDYSSAAEAARGEYCWFMSDDDVIRAGAIDKVLRHIQKGYDLIIANAQNRIYDLSRILEERQLECWKDRSYKRADHRAFFVDIGRHLSYIPAVIIKREVWKARDKESYYGTEFVHVGVIFQKALENDVLVIAEPIIIARQGNTSWSSKAFNIWMFRWPNLIWSFQNYSDSDKQKVFPKEPWRKLHLLLAYRAQGFYSIDSYNQLPKSGSRMYEIIARWIAVVPMLLVKPLLVFYLLVFERRKRTTLYGLLSDSRLKRWYVLTLPRGRNA